MQNKYYFSIMTLGLLIGLVFGCGSTTSSTTTTTATTTTSTSTTTTSSTTTTTATTTTSTSTTTTSTSTTTTSIISLTVAASTFADENNSNTPQNSLLTHEAGYNASLEASRYGFIQFDLSSIPSTSAILGATLNLYVTEVLSFETKIYFYVAGADWDQTTLTWDNMPSANGQFGIPAETFSEGQTGWVSIDANVAVQPWFNGSVDNYGMLLTTYNNNDTNILKYFSGASTSNKPYLEVIVR